MSLLSDTKEECIMIDKRTVPDGRGGIITTWEDGAPFQATIAKEDVFNVQIAMAQGVTSTYRVVTFDGVVLHFHDVFKRKKDGKIFRVKEDGEDRQPPRVASPYMRNISCVVIAEQWDLLGD